MKTKVFFTLILFSFFIAVHAQKITGYLPGYRNVTPVTNVQYDKLTDIVFAFINPDLTGKLIQYNLNPSSAAFDFEMSKFLEVKAHCKTYNVRLHIAIGGADGGGLRDARLATVCGAAGTRGVLVADLMKFAITHELAGIDIDWEFPNGAGELTSHQNLLSELRTAINASSRPDLILSVAVGGEYPPTSSPSHLDYINAGAVGFADVFYIMAYDLPGAYGTNHASLTSASSSMNTWNTNKGVPKAKMQLGVPFYGRNSARTLIQEYGVLAAAAPATVFGADSYTYAGNTYYYNGSATLQLKVDEVTNVQCGQGIMIWDLGEDRTDAYSLLGAINTRMINNCNFIPNLGVDKTLCGGNVTLDCGLAAVGKTFSWKRNGVTMAGVTTPSTVVTQGGTYIVTVAQGCCTKTDEVVVLEGATVTGTGDTRCGTGIVNLAITSGAGTYDWYTALTSGTKLNTGTTYAPSISATTTYYVQRNYGNKMHTGGKQFNLPSNCWTERWQDEDGPVGFPEWAQRITVNTNVTIDSLKIWRSNATINGVTVKVYAADGSTLVATSTAVNIPAIAGASVSLPQVNTLAVGISLTPGTYFIGVHAPVTGVGLYVLNNTAGTFSSTSVTDVFTIDANTYRNFGFGFTGATVHYGSLFDIRISSPIVSACPRTPITGTVNCTPVVTLVSPAPPGPTTHTVNTALSLTSSATDDGTIVSMSYVIRRVSDGVIVATVPGGAGPTYAATWTPTINQDYTVTARATDNGGVVGTSTAATVTVAPLPVSFVSFSGKQIEGGNLIKWATASELNNSHFELERSRDGSSFTKLERIDGKGFSIELNNYSYLDVQPAKGVNFYRLVQYDFNGESKSTEIIQITNEEKPFCSVTPNPFTSAAIVVIGNLEEGVVELMDVHGVVISTTKISNAFSELEIGATLTPGVYQIRISSKDYLNVFKIVKV